MKIQMDGFWYEYEYKIARHLVDICMASEYPELYCNGYFLHSTKDPGHGKEFVITDTNDPEAKDILMRQMTIAKGGSVKAKLYK